MAPSFAPASSSVMASRLCDALHAPSSHVYSTVLPSNSLASRLIRSTASEAAPAMVRPPVHSPEIGRRMPIRMDPFAPNVADCEETGRAHKNEQNAQTTYRLLPVLSNPRAIPQLVDQRSGIEKRSGFFCGDALKGWTVSGEQPRPRRVPRRRRDDALNRPCCNESLSERKLQPSALGRRLPIFHQEICKKKYALVNIY